MLNDEMLKLDVDAKSLFFLSRNDTRTRCDAHQQTIKNLWAINRAVDNALKIQSTKQVESNEFP